MSDKEKTIINVKPSPAVQDQIWEVVLQNSIGVSLGIILTIAGTLSLAKWLGLNQYLDRYFRAQEKTAESLSNLTANLGLISKSIERLISDNAAHHHNRTEDHREIVQRIGLLDDKVDNLHKEIIQFKND